MAPERQVEPTSLRELAQAVGTSHLAVHQRPGTEGFLGTVTEPWLDAAAEVAATHLGYEPDRIDSAAGNGLSQRAGGAS